MDVSKRTLQLATAIVAAMMLTSPAISEKLDASAAPQDASRPPSSEAWEHPYPGPSSSSRPGYQANAQARCMATVAGEDGSEQKVRCKDARSARRQKLPPTPPDWFSQFGIDANAPLERLRF